MAPAWHPHGTRDVFFVFYNQHFSVVFVHMFFFLSGFMFMFWLMFFSCLFSVLYNVSFSVEIMFFLCLGPLFHL